MPSGGQTMMVQGVSNSIELIENELTFNDRNPLYSFVALFREIIS
jgi:hypothetical protein